MNLLSIYSYLICVCASKKSESGSHRGHSTLEAEIPDLNTKVLSIELDSGEKTNWSQGKSSKYERNGIPYKLSNNTSTKIISLCSSEKDRDLSFTISHYDVNEKVMTTINPIIQVQQCNTTSPCTEFQLKDANTFQFNFPLQKSIREFYVGVWDSKSNGFNTFLGMSKFLINYDRDCERGGLMLAIDVAIKKFNWDLGNLTLEFEHSRLE